MSRWEGSEHWPLIAGRQWDLLEAILTDPAFLEAKVEAGLVFALVEDFAAALAHLPPGRPGRWLVGWLARAVRRDACFLARHPGTLFQCLWNTCWWHDGAASDRPGPRLATFLENWRQAKTARTPGHTWVRSLRPPIIPLDSPLLASFPVAFPSAGRVRLAFTPDGERLGAFFVPLPGGARHAPRVWDVFTGEELAAAAASLPPCPDSLVSPDGRYRLRLGSWDDPVRLCEVAGGREVATLPTDGEFIFCAAAFSPDGKRVAAGGYAEGAGVLLVWDLATKRRLAFADDIDSVGAVAFAPDGERVACGTSKRLEVREARTLATGRTLATLHGHEGMVRAVAFAPDGRLLASAGDDGTVRLWDLTLPAPPPQPAPHPDDVQDLVFSTDGRRLVSRSVNDPTWLWDGNTGAAVACLYASAGVVLVGGSAAGCVFADHRRVLSVAWQGDGLWDAGSGALSPLPEGHGFSSSTRLAFAPDGTLLAVTHGHGSGRIRLLDTRSGAVHRHLDGHAQEVRVLAFAPDGRRLVSGASDGSLRVWSVDDSSPRACLDGHTHFVTDVAFSADGELVVSAAADSTVRVWDAATGSELACLTLKDLGEYGRSSSWSEGQKTHEEIYYAVQRVAFTPDGRSVVTLSDGDRLRWWDWHAGTCWRGVRGVGDFRAIAAGLPLRALVRDGEVVVEASETAPPLAWLPCAPAGDRAPGLGLRTHPGGRIWAGAAGPYLYHFALERVP